MSHSSHRRIRHTRTLWSITFLLAALVTLLIPAARALAHPADMYYQTHTIHLAPDGVHTTWTILPGTLLAYVTWGDADTNGDEAVSAAEAQQWAQDRLDDYFLVIDGVQVVWTLEAVRWPDTLVDFEVGSQSIAIDVFGAWAAGSGDVAGPAASHTLALYNRYQEIKSINWFAVQGSEALRISTPTQQDGALSVQVVPGGSAAEDDLRESWDSGMPTVGAGATVRAPAANTPGNTLTRLVREQQATPGFYVTAFAIALGLGALHALTPGHGKTLVGAYLVGTRGTLRHAVALGSIVTVTHTGSVLALGVITLAASHILLPTTLFPLLEMTSGLLVIGMGALLLVRRWRAWGSVRAARQRRAAALSAPHSAPVTSGVHTIVINQPIQVNVYDAVLPRESFALSGVNWRALVALGISGGMVPCPDAIAILLVAVAINRVVLGLSLIVAFSLGLAGILTAIGIMMVRSRRLFEGRSTFERVAPALPLISALVVIGLGAGLTIGAAQRSPWFQQEADSQGRLDFARGSDSASGAAFRLETASVILLDTDSANRYQVYITPASAPGPVALTVEPFGVWDYQLSPDASTIAYTAPRQYGGSDVWLIAPDGTGRRTVLACETAACAHLQWAPDGARLSYERTDPPTPQQPLGLTTLWWLDPATGDTAPLFSDSQLPSFNGVWSPDGQWLAYVAPGSGFMQLYNLGDGRRESLPTQTGSAAIWSPDGRALLYTDIRDEGGESLMHLLRYTISSGTTVDLTGPGSLSDTWATWSPDGTQIAVVRRVVAGPQAELGDQIWLMDSEGGGAHPLTQVADVMHGPPVWSPDGRALLFHRYVLAGSAAAPGVWRLDVPTQTLTQTATGGMWPTWLP